MPLVWRRLFSMMQTLFARVSSICAVVIYMQGHEVEDETGKTPRRESELLSLNGRMDGRVGRALCAESFCAFGERAGANDSLTRHSWG